MSALLLMMLAQGAVVDGGVDPAFTALEAEVKRAMTLSMPASKNSKAGDKPYFALGSLNEQEDYTMGASFGALVVRGGGKRLTLGAKVRVGSMKFDNTNFRSFGEGRRMTTPAELDVDALRTALWLRFDGAYKASLEDLARKRAFLETTEVTESIDDYSPAKVSSIFEPRQSLATKPDAWAQMLRDVSGVFVGQKELVEGLATLRVSADTQSLVTSEGAKHRFSDQSFALSLFATAIGSDGAEVRLSKRFTGRQQADVPPADVLKKEARALGAKVVAVAKAAPAAEDYSGPVLLTGQAAALFFLETVGEPLSSPRDELGSRASGRLTERLGKHVASALLDVRDDPTQKTYTMPDNTQVPLWGHYSIDDESVLPKPITLIEAGVLKDYFMSRTPTLRIKATNGHCRGETGAPGNLFVTGKEKQSLADLKKRLVALAKEEDSDFGLMVELVEEYVPRSWGNEGQRLSNPLIVTKVYADGREVPVRGLTFKPVSQRVLKDVLAVGDDVSVLNFEHRGQATSVVAPSVLIRLLELSRVKEENDKPPALARP